MRTLTLLAMLALSGHQPWFVGSQGSGAVYAAPLIVSSTANQSTSGGSTVTVTVPTIQTGDLLVALTVDSWQLPNNAPTATGLTFTAAVNYGSTYGSASIWTAVAASGASNRIVTYTESNDSVAMTVLVIKGYSTDFSNTVTFGAAATTTASASITRQYGSIVVGAAQGYTDNRNASPLAGTTELMDLPDNGPTFFNSQIAFASTELGSGSITVGETWAAAQDTALVLLEIKKAP